MGNICLGISSRTIFLGIAFPYSLVVLGSLCPAACCASTALENLGTLESVCEWRCRPVSMCVHVGYIAVPKSHTRISGVV